MRSLRGDGRLPHETMSEAQAAIIGAGPAGLMAAEVLAQGGARVTVYDAMPSVGRKFLMAGRGGLNLTHSEPLPEFLARYREAAPHLEAAIAAFPPERLREWSEALGQPTFVGSSGRVFPQAFKASPLAARLAAAAGCVRRAVRVASSLDRLGRRRPSVVSSARRATRDRGARDGAGARRRELAAARLGRRVGGGARGEGRRDIAAAVRPIAASPSPGPTSFATASRASR